MNEALARLRAADPGQLPVPFAADQTLERILATPRPGITRRRVTPRRLVIVGLTAAAMLLVGTVATPSRDGMPLDTAYAISRSGDGVQVEVHWTDLDDLGGLQSDLRAAGVPAVVMRTDSSCTVPRKRYASS